MEELAAFLLGLLGGGTLGAIAVALLTLSHERAERFRDRRFEAANGFIVAYEAALTANVELWEAVTDMLEAKDRAIAAAGPAHESVKDPAGIEDALAEVAKAINLGLDLMDQATLTRRVTEEMGTARAVVEAAIATVAGHAQEPFSSSVRELLRALQQASDALDRQMQSSAKTRGSLHQLNVNVASLNLFFAGEDAAVVEAAEAVRDALLDLAARILSTSVDADPEEREQESDSISDAIVDVNELLASFSVSAHNRVRPRGLLADLIKRKGPAAN